jgi:hypothetical protein
MSLTREEISTLLKAGNHGEWNSYRAKNPDWNPDLQEMDLDGCDLHLFDLSRANLCGTMLGGAQLVTLEAQATVRQSGEVIKNGGARKSVKLIDAIYDIRTTFPRSFDPIVAGAKFLSGADSEKRKMVSNKSVFISYAWANEDIVLAIDQWLRDRNLTTRIDRRDFFAGSKIRDEILRVMQKCEVILVFHSEKSRDKPWIEFERDLASDLEMEARREKRSAPRIIFFVIDDTPLPSITERSRIAIMAKGRRFRQVCEELYNHIVGLTRSPDMIDLNKWEGYIFGGSGTSAKSDISKGS